MAEIREIASGLQFPEGPIAMPDGSVILVEIKRGTLSRVTPNGKIEVIAETGGGPNGAAFGPDGKVYVCNDGGFEWSVLNGLLIPGHQPKDYSGGRIERVDIDTGKVEVLYTECNGHRLCGPNDIVFDKSGGFWFTDHGKHRDRDSDTTGVYYAKTDGSMIREVIFPIQSPNGIGLSPDEKKLYVAETWTARVWQWDLPSPGQIKSGSEPFTPGGGTLLAGLPGFQLLDSMAVDSAGYVCVATIINGGVTAISPDGKTIEHVPLPDPLTTNVCFGGPDMKTAYATLSGYGKLVSFPWPRPGLKLNFT